MKRTIAYVMSRFPSLTETFILREMNELERQGWQVALYPLIVQRQKVAHSEAEGWIPRIRHSPPLAPCAVAENLRALRISPRQYTGMWAQALWENRTSPNLWLRALAVLPQATWSARQMVSDGVAHVHAHYATHPALAAWAIHRLTGIPYSITVHAHDIYVRTSMLGAKVREAEFVAAISEYNRERLAQTVGEWAREKTHVVHCGINPATYSPRPADVRRGEQFEILNIGSLQPYKGHPHLIRACALLRDRGVPVHCRIIGQGEEHERLERMIAAEGLEGVVELLGPRTEEEVALILQNVDCYAQPSIITASGKMEGIPVALMEALACALPVVATSISGVPELVRPGETGYLVPPADVPALADALAAVYADLEGAAQRGIAGRELVLREFDLRANVACLASLFESVSRAGQFAFATGFAVGENRPPGESIIAC